MRPEACRQGGFMMMVVVVAILMIALGVLVSQTGDLVAAYSKRFSGSDVVLSRVQQELVNYVANYDRLPCPADPTGAVGAGWPNGNSDITVAATSCTYGSGVVPWKALGLTQEDVTDSWGRLISYRVYDGTTGLTQTGGASAVNCDTSNIGTPETPPGTDGLCNADHNTLDTSFVTYPATAPYTYQKGLTVSDFGTTVSAVAYVLVSHGASGLGGYLPSGTQMTLPDAAAADYPNTQSLPAQFIKMVASATDVAAGSAGHFDDVVSYLKIADLLSLARLAARDWPEVAFDANTTASMTSPSTDPSSPHFLSTGDAGSGREFTSSQGGTAVDFGAGVGAYSACLWWPNKLTLVGTTGRIALSSYVEFAATDFTSDDLPGFTVGFLAGTGTAPSNSTCGTTFAATTTATGASGQFNLVVASTTGISTGMVAFGNGIPFNAMVSFISGSTVTLNRATTSAVSGTVRFADAAQIRRDIGWAGGTLATGYTNRFAVEFDATRSTTPTTANDPVRPHVAVDFTGVNHGTDAGSCSELVANGTNPGDPTSGLPCDSEAVPFAVVTKTASGSSGNSQITITDSTGIAGIVHGMTATGTGIPSSTTVTAISGSVLTLSKSLTGSVGTVTFSSSSLGTYSTSNFMQNGTTVFSRLRVEVFPKDCVQPTGTGSGGENTIEVSDSSQIQVGMSVNGIGVAKGATVTGISDTIITLSVANSSAVSGSIVFGGASAISTTATGASGQTTVIVASPTGIYTGMAVLGTGIGSAATVESISGSIVTLTVANTSALSGSAISFLPARTLVKAWTLSNAGCNQDSAMCLAFKEVNTKFTTAGGSATSTTASGTSGQTTISVASASGIAGGMAVSGTGIASGATVRSVSGTTVTLSSANSSTVSGTITFDNRQIIHAVSCVPAATVSNAYDSLYVGLTSANRTVNAVASSTGSGSSGANTIVVSNATNIGVGMSVRGTGIGDNALVTNVSGTTVTLSVVNAGTVSGTISFAGGENLVFQGLTIGSFALP